MRRLAAVLFVIAVAVLAISAGTSLGRSHRAPAAGLNKNQLRRRPVGRPNLRVVRFAHAVARVQADQTQSFAILAQPTVAADALPQSLLARGIAQQLTIAAGANVTLARATTTSAGTAWVVPGDQMMCVVVAASSGAAADTCLPNATAATGRGVLWGMSNTGSAPTYFVGGLVPNGVNSVTLSWQDGTDSQVQVSGNVWVATSKSEPVAVSEQGTGTTVDLGG